MKITNEYMSDCYLQACDLVRIIHKVIGYKQFPLTCELKQFVVFACAETGWNPDLIIRAIENPEA